jgi:hypothetical protein
MRKQNYELNDNCGSRISSIFMPSTRVQSLNHVSVNECYYGDPCLCYSGDECDNGHFMKESGG